MVSIRLLLPLRYDHISLGAGTIIALSREDAQKLIATGIAEMAEPERAVIEPQETRVRRNYSRRADHGNL